MHEQGQQRPMAQGRLGMPSAAASKVIAAVSSAASAAKTQAPTKTHLLVPQQPRHVAAARQRVRAQQEGAGAGHHKLALPHACTRAGVTKRDSGEQAGRSSSETCTRLVQRS